MIMSCFKVTYWHRYLFSITLSFQGSKLYFPDEKSIFGIWHVQYFLFFSLKIFICEIIACYTRSLKPHLIGIILPRVVHKYFCFLAQSTHASRLFQLTQNWNQVIAQSTLLKETKKHSLIALIDNLDLFIIAYICCVQWRSTMHTAFKTCKLRTLNLLSK